MSTTTYRHLRFDNLLVYEGPTDVTTSYIGHIQEHGYFPLSQRLVAKWNNKSGIKDAFYEFTVFDLWNEMEM
jgi:hypothetical protein